MDTGTSATRFGSYARACRRLAGEVANHGAQGNDAAMQTAARLLREASDHFVAMAGSRASRLPEWLVQSALTDLLEPEATTAGNGPETATPTLQATGELATTADLVSFLAVGRRSGRLEITTATERFLLVLDDGDIVHAESDNAPLGQRLGDILVASGAVTAAAIDAVLADCTVEPLGRALWRRGLVTREALLDALEQQIRMQFARMFELPAQAFVFRGDTAPTAHHELRLNATGLILDGARAADERSRTS